MFACVIAGVLCMMTACGTNNNGTTNNAADNNGTMNDGTTNNGSTNNGTTNNGNDNNGVVGDVGEDIVNGVEDLGRDMEDNTNRTTP